MILSDDQLAMRNAVRTFARERIAPHSSEWAANSCYPSGLFEEVGSLGLFGMIAPECYGGAACDYVSYALALMEIAAADGALSTIISIQNSIMVAGLLKEGTPEQKERFLPELVSGRVIGAFALTEADAGSDASAIRTRARRVDGGWVIDGSKQFITSGKIAGLAIVIAVTDASAGKRGLTSFLLPTNRPGYEIDKIEHKMGQTASDTCCLRFDNLFIEDELVLGTPGQGYRIALANLETGRIGIAAQCVGMADAAMEIAVNYAKQRRSMGKFIIEHQAVGFRLADLASKLEAVRQLTLHVAALKGAGEPCLKEASMAKLFASETAETVVSGCMQTLGGYGYLEEFGIARIYRDVRVCQIYEGTSDIQRMVIARAL